MYARSTWLDFAMRACSCQGHLAGLLAALARVAHNVPDSTITIKDQFASACLNDQDISEVLGSEQYMHVHTRVQSSASCSRIHDTYTCTFLQVPTKIHN